MDPATAGLIGASLGAVVSLIASVVVPFIRDAIEQRRRQDSDRREALRAELNEFSAAIVNMARVRADIEVSGTSDELRREQRDSGLEALLVISRINFLLRRREEMLSGVLSFVAAGESSEELANRLSTATFTIAEWHRGEIRARRVWRVFAGRMYDLYGADLSYDDRPIS